MSATIAGGSEQPPPAAREGAEAHIDAPLKDYVGRARHPFRGPGEPRAFIRVEPAHGYAGRR
jgi:hypothetical protein